MSETPVHAFKEVVTEFDGRSLRSRLGRFATGITVVTARDPRGGYVGRTINSFSSVSLEPALILWSLGRSSSSRPAYEAADYFVVNVLGVDQIETAERFARMGPTDPFEEYSFSEGLGGAPILDGCAVAFECRKYDTYGAGDHIIFLGEILRFRETEKRGLVFHNGSYAVTRPHPAWSGRCAEVYYLSPF